MEKRHRGQHGPDCFGCKVQTVQLPPSATPSRKRKEPTDVDKSNANAWERGIVKDDRGMPYLESNLEPIGLKEWVNKRGHYEERRDLLHHQVQQANASEE